MVRSAIEKMKQERSKGGAAVEGDVIREDLKEKVTSA